MFKLSFTKHLNSAGEDCITQYLSDGITYPCTIFFHFLLVGVHCFAMQPNSFDKFLIGSEDGHIYLCTTQFSSEALRSFDAHHTPVQTISWNTYIPSVFISCASELMVKIWTKDLRQPMFSFDLQSQVNFAYIDSPIFCYIFKGT